MYGQMFYDYDEDKLSMLEMVQEFHRKHGIESAGDPYLENTAATELRVRLIEEEFTELKDALAANNKVEAADALGDMLYLIFGGADIWGIDIERVFAEIHRSNMTKDVGPTRGDGKILKGSNYSPPDLSFVR